MKIFILTRFCSPTKQENHEALKKNHEGFCSQILICLYVLMQGCEYVILHLNFKEELSLRKEKYSVRGKKFVVAPYFLIIFSWLIVEMLFSHFSHYFLWLIIIVLKIGSDRPVRPVELGTGQVFGSVISKKSFHPKIGIEPAKPAENR